MTSEINDEAKNDIIKAHLSEIGRKGGDVIKKRGLEYYRKIGSMGGNKRWAKYRALKDNQNSK